TPQGWSAYGKLPNLFNERRRAFLRKARSAGIEAGVDLDEGPPLGRNGPLGIDRADRTGVHAGAAVDATLRIDEAHLRIPVRVDAVDRADLHAGLVVGS